MGIESNKRFAGLGFVFRLSWRNIWRNRGRSMTLMTAIGLGLIGGTFAMAMVSGFMNQRFFNAIEKQYSHLQVHSPAWLDEGQPGMFLSAGQQLHDSLASLPEVAMIAARTLANGLLASPTLTQGVEVRGIDPTAEQRLIKLDAQLIGGAYLTDSSEMDVLLGARLAKKLKVELGSRVVISFPNAEQDIVSAAFRVKGLFRTANAGFDQSTIYVQAHQLQSLLNEAGAVYELGIRLNEADGVPAFAHQLGANRPDLTVRSWRELAPELAYMQDTGGVVSYIFVFIILLGLSFGILNSMLMAVYERMRELGMLKALGMKKSRIFLMIMTETLVMSLLGSSVGIFLGGLLVKLTGSRGIDLSSYADGLAEFGYDAVLYPELSASYALNVTLLVIALSLLASIYPALKALKLNAADAIRS